MNKQSTAILKDLYWLITSPNLICPSPPLCETWANGIIDLPALLRTQKQGIPENLLQSHKPPIGRYFEALVAYWVKNQKDVLSIEENIQVREAKKTLGEFDLLIKSPSLAFHWELSVKFYLGTDDRTQLCNWYGPMAKDRFDIKLDKLASKQLKLGQSIQGKTTLDQLSYKAVAPHPLVKGRLFHPFDDWLQGHFIKPPGVNPRHDKGWWLYLDDIDKLQQLTFQNYVLLEKPNWFSVDNLPEESIICNTSDLVRKFKDMDPASFRPTHLALLDYRGEELHRGFIQPNNWPDT